MPKIKFEWIRPSGRLIIDSGTHAVTDFLDYSKKLVDGRNPKWNLLNLNFWITIKIPWILARRKNKNLKFKLFVESKKYKTDFSKSLILIGQTILDFGNSDFWKIWLWKPLYLNIFLCVINYFVTIKLNYSLTQIYSLILITRDPFWFPADFPIC